MVNVQAGAGPAPQWWLTWFSVPLVLDVLPLVGFLALSCRKVACAMMGNQIPEHTLSHPDLLSKSGGNLLSWIREHELLPFFLFFFF